MKLNKKKIQKIALYLVSIVGSIYIVVRLYSLIFEQDKLAIDKYNFEQLEKAIPTLNTIPKNIKKTFTVKEFNKEYKLNIKPIKNCYYIRVPNGDREYIFGFQIESMINKFIYFGTYYTYKKYDLKYVKECVGGRGCYDRNSKHFRYVISNPCKE